MSQSPINTKKFFLTAGAMFAIAFCSLAPGTVAQSLNSRSATASAYIERGNTWIARGDYQRALADFDLAVASDPGNAVAYYINRGAVRLNRGDVDGAIEDGSR